MSIRTTFAPASSIIHRAALAREESLEAVEIRWRPTRIQSPEHPGTFAIAARRRTLLRRNRATRDRGVAT